MRRRTAFVLAAALAGGAALPALAAPKAGLSNVKLKSGAVSSGGPVVLSLVLENRSTEDWAPGAYGVVILVEQGDRELARTEPRPVRKAVPAGRSTELQFADVALPAASSGPATVQALLVKDGDVILGSERLSLRIEAPQAPEEEEETEAPKAPGTYADALREFRRTLSTEAFAGARLSPQNRLVLDATKVLVSTGSALRETWMKQAAEGWRKALAGERIVEPHPLIETVWPDGGSLWTARAEGAQELNGWADDHLAFTPQSPKNGRLFGFVGGQWVTGGPAGSLGLNGRLGTTLFNGRYDASVAFGYTSVNTDPSVTILNIGLVGRMLFPVNKDWGWNLGAQIQHSAPSVGDSTDILSVLGGVSFYLPGGSFDVTAQLGNNSTYGLIAGYTFYFARR